jgi:hypothetical protein
MEVQLVANAQIELYAFSLFRSKIKILCRSCKVIKERFMAVVTNNLHKMASLHSLTVSYAEKTSCDFKCMCKIMHL